MTALKLVEGGTAQRRSRLTLPDFQWLGSTSAEPAPAIPGGPWFDLELWSDALLETALSPADHIDYFQLSAIPSSRMWSRTMADCVDRLGRMRDGWAGSDTKAPPAAAIREIQALTPFLPLMTRTPDIEVDSGDGEIKLAWRAAATPRSIAIAFCGDSIARVIQSNLNEPVQNPLLEVRVTPRAMADFAIALTRLENCDLLEVE